MYKNIISLGFFCSVAEDLESHGFRQKSYPFDWTISNFKGVIELIENNFEDLLNEEFIYQKNDQRNIYMNKKYNLFFFHDFSKYKRFEEQVDSVREKYDRRITSFYKDIVNPNILIRYIENEEELSYIEENIEHITNLFCNFNKNNELIFIANNNIKSDIIEIYSVIKDENDTVARRPFEQLPELVSYLSKNYDSKLKEENISFFNNKKHKEISFFGRVKRRIVKGHRYSKSF